MIRHLAVRTFLVVLGLCLISCGGGGSAPQISDAKVGEPTGPNAALYFTAAGYGTADALVGASTDVAASVALHESVIDDDGTMSMQHLDEFALSPAGSLVLEPGGLHLMLIEVEPLTVGSSVEIVLEWEVAGEQVIEADVVEPSDTMGEG